MPAPARAARPKAVGAVTDKPAIAVLPFANMSGDPEQEFFADGLTEDIITALSRFRELFVISRNSAFVYKNRAVRIQEWRRSSASSTWSRAAQGRRRVRDRAADRSPRSDRHVWAERYDRELEDIFAIQDEVTAAIVATLPGRVEAASHERAKRKPTESMAAYECVLAGKVLHHRSTGRTTPRRSAARARDRARPQVRPAHAWKGASSARHGPTAGARTATPRSGVAEERRSRWRWTRTTATCTASSRRST